jgi:hypothetical protein
VALYVAFSSRYERATSEVIDLEAIRVPSNSYVRTAGRIIDKEAITTLVRDRLTNP